MMSFTWSMKSSLLQGIPGEGIYPGLIIANGARAEGIEANLFFTFSGLDAIHKARHEFHLRTAAPPMGRAERTLCDGPLACAPPRYGRVTRKACKALKLPRPGSRPLRGDLNRGGS